MNFAALMSKEISKAKSPAQTSSSTDSAAEKSDKKYIKRSELEAERLAAYNAEQEKLQREREERQARKRKLEEEEAEQKRQREEKKRRLAEESKRRREEEAEAKERERRKRLGLSEPPASSELESKEGTPAENEDEDLDEEELVARLRERGEPVRLFGESDKGRQKRYRRLVRRESNPQKKEQTEGPIPTSLELLPESEMKVPEKLPADDEGKRYLFRQLASYFTMVLKEWQIALSRREDGVKQSFQGRQAYNAMVQSRENMKPLFRQLENGSIEEEVLEPVREIVWHAQERRYVDANDGYLRLSIGKAYA